MAYVSPTNTTSIALHPLGSHPSVHPPDLFSARFGIRYFLDLCLASRGWERERMGMTRVMEVVRQSRVSSGHYISEGEASRGLMRVSTLPFPFSV
jgi:hypothetical protein